MPSLNHQYKTVEGQPENPKEFWIVSNGLWGGYRVEENEIHTELPQLSAVGENLAYRSPASESSNGPIRIGPFYSRAELDEALNDLRGEPTVAIYMSNSTGELYPKKVDNLSKDWRAGDYEGFGTLIAERPTMEAALNFIKANRSNFKKTLESKETRP